MLGQDYHENRKCTRTLGNINYGWYYSYIGIRRYSPYIEELHREYPFYRHFFFLIIFILSALGVCGPKHSVSMKLMKTGRRSNIQYPVNVYSNITDVELPFSSITYRSRWCRFCLLFTYFLSDLVFLCSRFCAKKFTLTSNLNCKIPPIHLSFFFAPLTNRLFYVQYIRLAI